MFDLSFFEMSNDIELDINERRNLHAIQKEFEIENDICIKSVKLINRFCFESGHNFFWSN